MLLMKQKMCPEWCLDFVGHPRFFFFWGGGGGGWFCPHSIILSLENRSTPLENWLSKKELLHAKKNTTCICPLEAVILTTVLIRHLYGTSARNEEWLSYDVKNSANLVGCYPPKILLDLQNSSYHTQPHSIISGTQWLFSVKYLFGEAKIT